jgi:integrase
VNRGRAGRGGPGGHGPRSEGLALQWDDLAFKSRELRVERSLDASGHVVTTKTGRARVVDMSVRLAVALQRLRTERSAEALQRGRGELPPWVFSSEAGTPLDLSNVTKGWRRVLKHAKLPGGRLLRPPPHLRDRAARAGRADHLRRRAARTHEADHDAPVVRALAPARGQALGRRARSDGFARAW